MDSYEYSEMLKTLSTKLENIERILKPNALKEQLLEIIKIESSPNFWEDAQKAAQIGQQKRNIERSLEKFELAKNALNDAKELFEISQNDNDESTLNLLFSESNELEAQIKKAEIETMLNDPLDSKNAIFTITPGAGGTEAADWASMLYRMYLRWAERRGFKVELLDYQEGAEAGIKDASFILKGENAYGYAKVESGVHRLVRFSPFDSSGQRHTSFASVAVSPEIDDDIAIEIDEKDLRVDTYRASGAGGQHVNKTESAIRITHAPSGIVVQCQNDRSQHKNKATALKMLRSKLYELEQQKRQAEAGKIEQASIGWASQIRNYVLVPYRQVKDVRSGRAFKDAECEAVLDGELDELIEGVLIESAAK